MKGEASSPSGGFGHPPKASPSALRFLIIRLSSFGDVVLTEPVVRRLRAAWPEAQIELLTQPAYAGLMAARAGVDAAHGLPPSGQRAFVRRLERYHRVLDLQGSLQSRWLARWIRAEQRQRVASRGLAEGLRRLSRTPERDGRHATARMLSVLGPHGPVAPRLATLDPEGDRGGGGIGLFPGARWATKRWPPERFAELATRLVERGEVLRLVGGAMDPLEAVARLIPPSIRDRVDIRRSTTLEALARSIEPLDRLISGDSGPAHLAAALGVPVIVLFGPTDPVRWGPIGPQHGIVRRNLPCMPCSRHGDGRCPAPGRHHACLRGLPVDRVLDAMMDAQS